jgi:hypothetical protein
MVVLGIAVFVFATITGMVPLSFSLAAFIVAVLMLILGGITLGMVICACIVKIHNKKYGLETADTLTVPVA